MPDFDDDLRALAGHAQRTGRLGAAAEIRNRADRRRKRRYAATAALGVALVAALGAGIAVAQPAPSPGPPAASASPSVPADVLSGARQVTFEALDLGQEVPGARLSVDADDRLQVVTGAVDERALFVPTPAARDQYLIKTGALRQGGKALCLSRRSNGTQPVTVVAATCESGDDSQLFGLDPNGEDEQNRANYAIGADSVYLQWDPGGKSGLVAAETGGYLPDTTFVPIDRGPSTVTQ